MQTTMLPPTVGAGASHHPRGAPAAWGCLTTAWAGHRAVLSFAAGQAGRSPALCGAVIFLQHCMNSSWTRWSWTSLLRRSLPGSSTLLLILQTKTAQIISNSELVFNVIMFSYGYQPVYHVLVAVCPASRL